ncbi:MAG: type II secretion system secretin GspD [Candidatus Hydrogenedentes bacterium]|nr:type II secretion system secretin GspD [Candidatus Hydrogenedentota bacterium]
MPATVGLLALGLLASPLWAGRALAAEGDDPKVRPEDPGPAPRPVAEAPEAPVVQGAPSADDGPPIKPVAPPPPVPGADAGETKAAPEPRRPPRRADTPEVKAEAGAAPAPERFAPPAVPDDQPLYLDFQDVDLEEVVKAVATKIGKNFDVDPTLAKNKVTIISTAPVPVDLAYEVLESIVSSRGGHLVEDVDGHLIKVVPTNKKLEKADTLTDAAAVPAGFDRVYTYIIGVKHADVTELTEILSSLGSESAVVNAYGVTNTLIMTDTADGINNMLEFLQEVDVPGFDEEMEIFTLEYARAEVLATQIQDVLLGPEGEPQRTSAAQAVRQAVTGAATRPIRGVPGQQKVQTIVGQREESLRIVSDERLNSLIVIATQGLMDRVRSLIDQLDSPPRAEANNMHVYHLLNADTLEVAEVLSSIVGASTPRQGAEGSQQASQTSQVQPFEKEVSITSYERTNSLLIVASPQDYKLLEVVIADLDVPPRQVHVEAIIAKVTINDTYALSVETAGLTANDAFTLNNIVQLANVLNGNIFDTDGVASSSVLAFGVLDGTTKLTMSDGEGGTVIQEVPNVPLLLTALESVTALDVLSRPSLTTVDNETASILIGQDVPVVSGSQSSLNQSSVGSSVYNRVERQDVGIKMEATPQISEGDFVFLELNVEVSALASADSSVGDANLLGPTLDKTEITDKVVIKDGGTGIVGGLISEQISRARSQTPLLGDLPLLGWLFRGKSDIRDKQNLVILVTPHIIKDNMDVERLTQYRTDEVSRANADVIFERGYIRKIKRKHYLRNRYRPGDVKESGVLETRGEFERGAIGE